MNFIHFNIITLNKIPYPSPPELWSPFEWCRHYYVNFLQFPLHERRKLFSPFRFLSHSQAATFPLSLFFVRRIVACSDESEFVSLLYIDILHLSFPFTWINLNFSDGAEELEEREGKNEGDVEKTMKMPNFHLMRRSDFFPFHPHIYRIKESERGKKW